jgi:hypothetical protein
MAIVGFSFTKVFAEKKSAARGRVNINNNVVILGVEDANLTMAQGKKGVRVRFLTEAKYEPDIGHITFEGEVILLEDAKVALDIIEHYAKDRSLPSALVPVVLNHVLDHSNVEALILARDMNLPAPIPLPKANLQPTPKAAPSPVDAVKAEKPKPAKKK